VAGGGEGKKILSGCQAQLSKDRAKEAFWEIFPAVKSRHGLDANRAALAPGSKCSFSAAQYK
jgi:hypothetical protein